MPPADPVVRAILRTRVTAAPPPLRPAAAPAAMLWVVTPGAALVVTATAAPEMPAMLATRLPIPGTPTAAIALPMAAVGQVRVAIAAPPLCLLPSTCPLLQRQMVVTEVRALRERVPELLAVPAMVGTLQTPVRTPVQTLSTPARTLPRVLAGLAGLVMVLAVPAGMPPQAIPPTVPPAVVAQTVPRVTAARPMVAQVRPTAPRVVPQPRVQAMPPAALVVPGRAEDLQAVPRTAVPVVTRTAVPEAVAIPVPRRVVTPEGVMAAPVPQVRPTVRATQPVVPVVPRIAVLAVPLTLLPRRAVRRTAGPLPVVPRTAVPAVRQVVVIAELVVQGMVGLVPRVRAVLPMAARAVPAVPGRAVPAVPVTPEPVVQPRPELVVIPVAQLAVMPMVRAVV